MSLFISDLSLGDELLESGKIGAFSGSAISAAVGCTVLWWFLRKDPKGELPPQRSPQTPLRK